LANKFYILILLSISVFGSDIDKIAKKIYQNECGCDRDKLVWWNRGENFPSLGIGHFIWYPKGVHERFEESFPKFISYLHKNSISTPSWLNSHAPWRSKEEMLKDPRTKWLKKFLYDHIDLQARFMVDRLKNSLLYLNGVKRSLKRLLKTSNGRYILVDYLNFKGLGDKPKERYKGQGWGLIQVLECMPNRSDPKAEFRECAKRILRQRVKNSPKNRGEKRWLKGWINRIESYR